MSSIFIILSRSGELIVSEIVENAMNEMGSQNWQFSDTWIDKNVGFGCHVFHTTNAFGKDLMPYADVSSKCIIVADARIDYRLDLLRKLKAGTSDFDGIPDNRLILMSYLKWGEDCVMHLQGDFAFAIWDKKRNKLFGARDHFGCRPLYYVDDSKYFVISSDPNAFKALPRFRFSIDEQFILDSISTIIPEKNRSAFKGVNKLPPAHSLTVIEDDTVHLKRYWDLKVQKEFINFSKAEAVHELRNRFIEAVKQRSYSDGPIGVELSGGLDSSGIAACIKDTFKQDVPVYAFTHDLDKDQQIKPVGFKSEKVFSSKLVKDKQIEKHYIITGEDSPGAYYALVNYLGIRPEAVVQSYGLLSDILYKKLSNTGATVLMSGFGGDEGVSYQGAGFVQELAAKREFKKLRDIIRSRIRKRSGSFYFQLIKQYIFIYIPWLIRFFKHDWRRSRFKVVALNPVMRKKYKMKRRFFNRIFQPNDPDVKRRQYKRLMHPNISYRLETSYLLSKTHGIEYRYPFLDVRLIEFFFSLPSKYNYEDGIGRHLFREAMNGILLDELRLRRDKTSATIPYVLYRVVKDESIFRLLIEEGRENNKIHYVDYDKLHWMLDQYKSEISRNKMSFGTKVFLNPISVLLLQKWQREGKIDIGIKC
ncbi:MAG: asparagine synthase-related protein [Bacteroidales bacterium]|nr:asparagine synthase-related protein [Bacteroidales bacterium]